MIVLGEVVSLGAVVSPGPGVFGVSLKNGFVSFSLCGGTRFGLGQPVSGPNSPCAGHRCALVLPNWAACALGQPIAAESFRLARVCQQRRDRVTRRDQLVGLLPVVEAALPY